MSIGGLSRAEEIKFGSLVQWFQCHQSSKEKWLETETSAGHHGDDTASPDPEVGIGIAVGPSCCSQLGQ
jgi:hypothetical protein